MIYAIVRHGDLYHTGTILELHIDPFKAQIKAKILQNESIMLWKLDGSTLESHHNLEPYPAKTLPDDQAFKLNPRHAQFLVYQFKTAWKNRRILKLSNIVIDNAIQDYRRRLNKHT